MSHMNRHTAIGKYFISLPALNKNKISVITGGSQHAKFRRELISDDLKNIIKKILKGNFNIEDNIDMLFDNERETLRDLLSICDIDNDFELNPDHAKDELISKFNIMRGELMTGNTSDELINQFSELLDELKNKKLLSLTEYKKLKPLCQT